MVKEIGDQTYLLGKDQVVLQTKEAKDLSNSSKTPKSIGEYKVVTWGADNKWPETVVKLVNSNHAVPQYLQTVAEFIIGNGIAIFKRVIVEGKEKMELVSDPEIEEWFERMDITSFIERCAIQWAYFGNIFANVTKTVAGKIASIECEDSVNVRIRQMEEGQIPGYVLLPDWSKPAGDKNKIVHIQAYRPTVENGLPFIIHEKRHTPGQPYYGSATWWGGQRWIEVSNSIPEFHKSGITNGYNIKYIVSIDQRYWEIYPADAREKAKADFRDNLDKFLAGVENVNKALLVEFTMDLAGKTQELVKITPVNNINPDGQYIDLDKQANLNMSQGHGINPVLASIDTGGKLGGSGAELRVAAQLHSMYKTPLVRKKILKILRICAKFEDWPADIHFGFRDIEVTTLDANPTGQKSVAPNSLPGS